VKTVAMESTGVYWIPLYEILEERGFTVVLVNARDVHNVPGRKSDVKDCEWLRELHSVGLLRARLYEVVSDKQLLPSCPHTLRVRGEKLLGGESGGGQRFCDAKPRRFAEAGQDSFSWPTTPLAASHHKIVVVAVSA
jgi:hypothetical protein